MRVQYLHEVFANLCQGNADMKFIVIQTCKHIYFPQMQKIWYTTETQMCLTFSHDDCPSCRKQTSASGRLSSASQTNVRLFIDRDTKIFSGAPNLTVEGMQKLVGIILSFNLYCVSINCAILLVNHRSILYLCGSVQQTSWVTCS